MIQSRPQFGYRGALLIWVFVLANYAGYNVFNNLLGGGSLEATVGIDADAGLFVTTGIAVVIAVFGYDVLHRWSRWFSTLFLVVYAVFTLVALFTLDLPAGALDPGVFAWTPFLIQFGVSAGYLVSWAIYVSDYSRYLPPDVGVRASFWWTYLGMTLGAIWLLGLGALVASAFADLGVIEAVIAAGDTLFDGFGTIAVLVAFPGLAFVMAQNLYGGSLTLLTMADSVKPIQPRTSLRIIGIAVVACVGLVLALAATDDFLADFTTYLTCLLYVFAPWTAVNLVDFFLVRRGHYSIREIFNPDGMYGRWSWRGLTAYAIGFAATLPFQSTSLYTGPVAKELGGADISPFFAVAAAGVAYWLLTRSLDVEAERRHAEIADAGLEADAEAELRPVAV
jgi:purine-cytosine permease-like protein